MKLDRTKLRPTFVETFDEPVSFYHPERKDGRWKTNYWFGDQKTAASRSLPKEKQIYVDQPYCGIDPFWQGRGGMQIQAFKNPKPEDPRTFNPYTGGKAPLPYVSGILTTETSFHQRYGYFEAQMAFPQVRGCWPAFWLLGPPHGRHAGDEIDVVEWVASNPRRLFFHAHLNGKAEGGWKDGYNTAVPHTYGVLWTRREIVWYVDDEEVFRRRNRGLHRPMYMLLNLAIGGWDQNLPEDPQGFPATLLIGDVRAYSLA